MYVKYRHTPQLAQRSYGGQWGFTLLREFIDCPFPCSDPEEMQTRPQIRPVASDVSEFFSGSVEHKGEGAKLVNLVGLCQILQ